MGIRYDLTNKFDGYMQALLNIVNAKNNLQYDKAFGIVEAHLDQQVWEQLNNQEYATNKENFEMIAFQFKLRYHQLDLQRLTGITIPADWKLFQSQVRFFLDANPNTYFFELASFIR